MKKKPCVPKSECWFNEDEYVKNNRAPLAKVPPTEEQLRRQFAEYLKNGYWPSKCDICGYHHK
jgi:hypothetical protein